MHSYKMNNVILGSKLEDAIKDVLSSVGYSVDPHLTTEPGIDVRATLGKKEIVCEALNWKGGFIHPLRFRSIVNNLIQKPDAKRHLVCFGTSPTREQYRILKGIGANVLVHREQLTILGKGIVKFLRRGLGVITPILSRPKEPLPQTLEEPKPKMDLNLSITHPQIIWLTRALTIFTNSLGTERWIQTSREYQSETLQKMPERKTVLDRIGKNKMPIRKD